MQANEMFTIYFFPMISFIKKNIPFGHRVEIFIIDAKFEIPIYFQKVSLVDVNS